MPHQILAATFDRWAAAGRGAEMESEHGDVARQVIAGMGIRAGDQILDLGCGSGEIYEVLLAAGIAPDRIDPCDPWTGAAFLARTINDVVLIAPDKGKNIESIQLFTSEGGTPSACFLNDGRIVVGDSDSALVFSAYPHAKQVSSIPLNLPDQKRRLIPVDFAAFGDHEAACLSEDGLIDFFG